MKLRTRLAAVILCMEIGKAFSLVINSPNVADVLAHSFTVSFPFAKEVSKYHVTVEPRHAATGEITRETALSTVFFEDLAANTVYLVTVRADDGPAGKATPVKTLPKLSVSTLRINAPLTDSVDLFFGLEPPVVTQWKLQLRENGSSTATDLTSDSRFTSRVTNLVADTHYEIRVRASQINGEVISDSEKLFSDWIAFTTESNSIFGSVVLANTNYVGGHENRYGEEWNTSRETIKEGYSSIDHNGVAILRIEKDGSGKARVHYRIKVKDKTLPSPTSFTLSGGNFINSFVNNGDRAVGTPYLLHGGSGKLTLLYRSPSSCAKIVERFMVVSVEDRDWFYIHLNVASSDATTAEEDDSLTVNADDGSLVRDDGKPAVRVSMGSELALTPRILVKDCLVHQRTTPLYSEFFCATDYPNTTNTTLIRTRTNPEDSSRLVNISAVTIITSSTSATFLVPAVKKAIKYRIMNGSSALSTLEELDIDGSSALKVEVDSLEPETDYNVTISVDIRNGPSSIVTRSSGPIKITTKATAITKNLMASAAPQGPTTRSSPTAGTGEGWRKSLAATWDRTGFSSFRCCRTVAETLCRRCIWRNYGCHYAFRQGGILDSHGRITSSNTLNSCKLCSTVLRQSLWKCVRQQIRTRYLHDRRNCNARNKFHTVRYPLKKHGLRHRHRASPIASSFGTKHGHRRSRYDLYRNSQSPKSRDRESSNWFSSTNKRGRKYNSLQGFKLRRKYPLYRRQ